MSDERGKEFARKVFESNRYVNLLGLKLIDIDYGKATLSLAMRDELRQVHGLMHGGAIASLIDTATGFTVASILDKDEKAATIDLTLHYLRPVTEGTLTCTAELVRDGKRFITLSAEAKNEQGKLVATALSTYTKV